MKKGQKVRWTTSAGATGIGEVITDEDAGHVQVAVNAASGEEHRVIYCAVTWLEAIE